MPRHMGRGAGMVEKNRPASAQGATKDVDTRKRWKNHWTAQVERFCASKGLQLTPLRRQILSILAQAPAPLGAYAIIEELSREQQKSVAPPTVYRTLEFFLEHGFLHKIESRNAYAPCEHLGHDHHGILLICERCGRTDEIENAGFDKLLQATAAKAGFVTQRQVVEIEGLCANCGHDAAHAGA